MKHLDESYINSLGELTEMVQEDAFAQSLTESDLALIGKMEEIQEAEVLFIKPSNTGDVLVASSEVNREIFEAAKAAIQVAYQETFLGEEDDEDEFDGDADDEGSVDDDEQFPQMESDDSDEDDEDEDEDEEDEDEDEEDSQSMTKEEAVSVLNTLDSLFESGEVTILTDLDESGITLQSHTVAFSVLAECAAYVTADLCEALGIEFEGVSLTEGVALSEGPTNAIAMKMIGKKNSLGTKAIANLYAKDFLKLGKKGKYELTGKGKAAAAGIAAGTAGLGAGAVALRKKTEKNEGLTNKIAMGLIGKKDSLGTKAVANLHAKDFLKLGKKGAYELTGKGKAAAAGIGAAGLGAGALGVKKATDKKKSEKNEGLTDKIVMSMIGKKNSLGTKAVANLHAKDFLKLGKKGAYELTGKGKASAAGVGALGLGGVALGAKRIADKKKKNSQKNEQYLGEIGGAIGSAIKGVGASVKQIGGMVKVGKEALVGAGPSAAALKKAAQVKAAQAMAKAKTLASANKVKQAKKAAAQTAKVAQGKGGFRAGIGSAVDQIKSGKVGGGLNTLAGTAWNNKVKTGLAVAAPIAVAGKIKQNMATSQAKRDARQMTTQTEGVSDALGGAVGSGARGVAGTVGNVISMPYRFGAGITKGIVGAKDSDKTYDKEFEREAKKSFKSMKLKKKVLARRAKMVAKYAPKNK